MHALILIEIAHANFQSWLSLQLSTSNQSNLACRRTLYMRFHNYHMHAYANVGA